MEYTFILKYQLSDGDSDHAELVERLGAEGCDDALVGVGQPGRVALEFARESDTAEAALVSALVDVKRAIPTAKLIEVSPDFVGLTDAADVAGVTRQNMRKLMITHQSRFPAPVHEGSAAIWHLADILDWMQVKGGYVLEQTVVDVAKIAKQVNLSKESRFLIPRINRDVMDLVS
jgi:predicted DNA-binding transcriptional regulator AlpA